MLLPSGRMNNDVHTLQSQTQSQTQQQQQQQQRPTPKPKPKPQFLTRASSPQLTLTTNHIYATTTANKIENGCVGGVGDGGINIGNGNGVVGMLSTSPGSQNETGFVSTTDRIAASHKTSATSNATGTGGTGTRAGAKIRSTSDALSMLGYSGNWEEIERHLETMQTKLKEGWTVHVGKEGRLFYCNHLTQTAGWLPSCEDWCKTEDLPYGWERAVDSKGRAYYINHLNKTSTYEVPECTQWDEKPPEPREVVLQRSSTLGFGFVAGSEKPVIVRFVTEGGPSMNKLLPGDQILAVNGEDVKEAPRDHVIQLVRACGSQVTLLVCQPAHNLAPGRKSTLLSAGKRAKLRARPTRVRFAESVCVNGAPLFPPSAFSLGDICVPPMANVLKVFLENGQTKSFKYDATTTVQNVVSSLLDKLCLSTGEIFSLVLEHVKSLKRNKLTILDPEESLARIAARPGAHKLRCLFRVSFVPISAAELAQKDLNALDYLYMQCCNDVNQERFAPELQPEVALRLAALHMHQHALANNVSPARLTVKVVEREFGLERFVPVSLFEGMKRKELRRLISHFLKLNAEMTGSSTKVLTQLQAKLYYLDIIASLPSYGAKCFSTNQREGVERVLLVSPRFGLSQISNVRNSVPQPISVVEEFSQVIVHREDDVTCSVTVFLQHDRIYKFSMEDRDACEFSLVLAGYYRVLTGKELPVQRERDQDGEEMAPPYLAQHIVLPAVWSYLLPYHNRAHSINFLLPPPYHPMALPPPSHANEKTDNNMNSSHVADSNQKQFKPAKPTFVNRTEMDLDIHSVMATELLEEAKDSGMSDSSGGGSNYCERLHTPSSTAFIEAKNEEVLRRVQEMQKMVENSEQYLNEQGEVVQDYERQQSTSSSNKGGGGFSWQNDSGIGSTSGPTITTGGMIEFDSDCDSLNSSKISSNDETPQPGQLKHSDSLVLLAEAINQDLSGITKGLNSIGGSHQDLGMTSRSISAACSPRPERKLTGLGQLLSNLQMLGTDFSQSESDSESVNSPTSSPISRRPSLLRTRDGEKSKSSRQQNAAYRSSFGLHSPDGSNFGQETKDYNLKEYLQQLKDISNTENLHQDTDLAAKKLSEIYGFEIREDTFIETDADLIDLRAIPPPQTPDELDSISILNAAPQGFDDSSAKKSTSGNAEADMDLDKFLAKVVVAPPTQKATPAKELTPEEIMSFIIPPPPNLDEVDKSKSQNDITENLYSNSVTEKRVLYNRSLNNLSIYRPPERQEQDPAQQGKVIEYATVERKSKFSCCPKSKKEGTPPISDSTNETTSSPVELTLPPRSCSIDKSPPARPPKSMELLQRYSPKKQQPPSLGSFKNNYPPHLCLDEGSHPTESIIKEVQPPLLPPRPSPVNRNDEFCMNPSLNVSTAIPPKKPPLPPLASRPILRIPPNRSFNGTTTITTSTTPMSTSNNASPTQFRPMPAAHFITNAQQQQQSQPLQQLPVQKQLPSTIPHSITNGHTRSNSDCPPVCLQNPRPEQRSQLSLLCSPHMTRKIYNPHSPALTPAAAPTTTSTPPPLINNKLIIRNGHVIDGEALLAKTDVAMAGLLVKLDQIAAQCTTAQAAGGGVQIDEQKFQRARSELTEQTLVLVTASKFLVVAMSDMTLSTLPEHLTSCLTALRRITELTQDLTRHTSSPLQTRNIVLKVHDVASSFRELVGVQIGPLGAGQLALQAECLANVLATLLRSLRVFSP